jgi:hypothetical protein
VQSASAELVVAKPGADSGQRWWPTWRREGDDGSTDSSSRSSSWWLSGAGSQNGGGGAGTAAAVKGSWRRQRVREMKICESIKAMLVSASQPAFPAEKLRRQKQKQTSNFSTGF